MSRIWLRGRKLNCPLIEYSQRLIRTLRFVLSQPDKRGGHLRVPVALNLVHVEYTRSGGRWSAAIFLSIFGAVFVHQQVGVGGR